MVSRIGVASVVAIFAIGMWLVAAPFAVGFQSPGTGWSGATRTDEIVGGTLAMAGFAGLIGIIAGRVSEMYADARYAASLASAADRGNSPS